eukprot:5190983-Lingulodinium_polyedra.AAC.1
MSPASCGQSRAGVSPAAAKRPAASVAMACPSTLKRKSAQGSPGLVPASVTATWSCPGTVNHVEECISCLRA